MPRSSDIRRLEAALRGRNLEELAWGIAFCERMLASRTSGKQALVKANFSLWNQKRLEAVRRHQEVAHDAV
jgi:hypothetical protein